MTRALRVLSVVVFVVSITSLVAATLEATGAGTSSLAQVIGWPLPNAVVGLLLTYRRPRLLTGWLFAAIGLLVSTGGAAETLATRGLDGGYAVAPWWAVLGAWYGEWYWLPMLFVMLVFLPLLFPTGRPLTKRWKAVTITITVVVTAITVTAALQEQLDPVRGRSVLNPIGVRGLSDVEDGLLGSLLAMVGIISLLCAATGLVVRFRRSTGIERQQLKWFTSAGVALIAGFIGQGASDALLQTRFEFLDIWLFSLPPTAAAVAVFRYRLYAIDRIISRTVTYFLVTAVLIGVYAAAVAVMSAAIDPLAGQSPIAVAAATLLAAAMFRPVLTRVQQGVDRRFNRARYDARRTVEQFRDQVRSDVDLDRLCADLVDVADATLQPQTATVWLRPEVAR